MNGSFIEIKGLTADAEYSIPLDGIGVSNSVLNFNGNLYYQHSYKQSNNGVTIVNLNKTLAYPKFQVQGNVAVAVSDFAVNFQANYQSAQQFDRTFTAETRDILGVGKYWLFNLSLAANVDEQSQMRFTVSNLFDRDPPFPLTTNGLGIYDYLGRRFAISFDHKF